MKKALFVITTSKLLDYVVATSFPSPCGISKGN